MKTRFSAALFAAACFSLVCAAGAAPAQTADDAPQQMRIIKKKAKKPSAKSIAATKTLEGVIRKFECGDNCYLTIRTAKAEETGLCEAKACAPWFENQKMPRAMIGRKVRVTTGTGVQRDGSGNVMGKMTSFKTLDFVK
ncbi:MAG TPA: hypothetical protein PKA55_07750 [Rhodoblastus sp.]|nr:hypothetical protein [Rhodoblastus sp.]